MTRDDSFEALADDAPVMIWVSGPDGGYTWVNRQWSEFTGRALDAHLGEGWASDVHPDDVDRFAGAYDHAFETREPFEAEVRLRRDDGRYRWMLARGTPRHDDGGAFVGYVGTCTDISDRRDAEALVRFLARVGDTLTESFEATTTLQRVARLAVPDFADLCTIAVAEPDGRVRRVAIAHTDPAEEARLRAVDAQHPLATADRSAIAEAMRTGTPVYRPLVDAPGPDEPWPPSEPVGNGANGSAGNGRSLVVAPLLSGRGTLGACAMVSWNRRYTPGDVALVQEFAHRCAAAVDTAHLFRELEERRERLSVLAGVGEQLASTLDLAETTKRVLERIVPAFADFGVVALGERGHYARVDVHSIDRAREADFRAAYTGKPIELDGSMPIARVVRTGEPMLIETVPAPARRPERDAVGPLRALDVTSLLAVPVANDDDVEGALLLGYSTSGRRYGASDIPLALDIARRLSLGVERARTYFAERRIAETLQRSLLPEELPDLPNVGLCARYLPGGRAEIGGDWYDVIPLDQGRLGIVIGDVAGHGVRAAAVMGQLRNALRAYAGEGYAPAALMERLNRFVFANGPSDMATLCYAVLDPTTGEVQTVAAGHPSPVHIDAQGDAAWLQGVGGPPIGADPRSHYRATTATLGPGDTIVMYTDGLVERRRESLDVGLQRLLDATMSVPATGALDVLCDHLTATVLPPDGGEDDVAVLAVRFLGTTAGGFRWRRPARASELGPMRRVLSAWLENAGVPRDELTLVAVAVSEAVTNAIEHAYGKQEGWVEIEAHQQGEDVEVAVRDGGRWRPKAPGGGGRGLGLIGRLMDEFELRRTDQGTEVWMRRIVRGRNGG